MVILVLSGVLFLLVLLWFVSLLFVLVLVFVLVLMLLLAVLMEERLQHRKGKLQGVVQRREGGRPVQPQKA